MADVFDIQNAIAADVNTAVQQIVGSTFSLPTIDGAVFGATRTVPSIELMPGNILLEEIMNRLEQGKAQIQIEAEDYDLGAPQYLQENDIEPQSIPVPLLGVAIAGSVITISGAIQIGDVVGIQLGQLGAGYAVQANDTLTTIATGLAASCVTAGITCSHTGATVTVTASGHPTVSVGTTWSRTREIMRRRKMFFASIYAATPYDRSAIGKTVETVYASGTRLLMPDGTLATLIPVNGNPMQSTDFDGQQRDTTYMRRVSWAFDFISTQTLPVTQVVAETISFTGEQQILAPVAPLTPPTAAQL